MMTYEFLLENPGAGPMEQDAEFRGEGRFDHLEDSYGNILMRL